MHTLDLSRDCAVPAMQGAPSRCEVCTVRPFAGKCERPQGRAFRTLPISLIPFFCLLPARHLPCCGRRGLLCRVMTFLGFDFLGFGAGVGRPKDALVRIVTRDSHEQDNMCREEIHGFPTYWPSRHSWDQQGDPSLL